MKKISFLFIFLFIYSSFAQEEKNPLTEMTIISESTPYEFELLIDQIKTNPVSDEDLKVITTRLNFLNQDLKGVDKRTLMFLFKSEIYKGVLNNQYLNLKNKLQINLGVINNIDKKLAQNKIIYSKFSTWIADAVLKDFSSFRANNFLNTYQNIQRSDTKGLIKAKKLQKIIKYTSPIIEALYTLSPEKFNQLSTKIAIDILDKLSKKSFYFKTYQGILSPVDNGVIIKVPELKFKDPKEPTAPIESLKKESILEKEKAIEIINKLDEPDLSGVSDEIDKIDETKQ